MGLLGKFTDTIFPGLGSAIDSSGGLLGGGNKQGTSTATTSTQLNPVMQSYLFGSGSDGQPKPNPQGVNGYFSDAYNLYQQGAPKYFEGNTYAGFNPAMANAIGGLENYYQSPQSMAGANAASSLGNSVLGKSSMQVDPFSSGQNFSGAQTFNALPSMAPGQQVKSPTIAPATQIAPASVGSSGVDWKTAMNDTLKGEVNNPYLAQLSANIGRSTSDNYLRNIAPQISSGAQLAGQFGGSRHGVVEANALRDLNRGVSDSVTNLYGNAYNNAQTAKNSAALSLSGQESGERVSQAQIAQQAALAQAQIQAQKEMAQAQMDYQAQRDNQLAALQLGGLAIQDKLGTGNLNLNSDELALRGTLGAGDLNLRADNQNFNQQAAGVGLLQQAAQQPVANAQGLLGIGALQQQNTQNQINADKARWDYNQSAPWQNLSNYGGLLTGSANLGATSTQSTPYNYNPTMQTIGALGSLAQAAGPFAAMMSDRRIKKDIQQIGLTEKGIPLYLFRYQWDSQNESPRVGVMAQDVEQVMPEAVIEHNGIKMVNYGMVM